MVYVPPMTLDDIDVKTVTPEQLGAYIFQLDQIIGRKFFKLPNHALQITVEGLVYKIAACQRMNVDLDPGVAKEMMDDALNGRAFFPRYRNPPIYAWNNSETDSNAVLVNNTENQENTEMARNKRSAHFKAPPKDADLSDTNKVIVAVESKDEKTVLDFIQGNQFISVITENKTKKFGGCNPHQRYVLSMIPRAEFSKIGRDQFDAKKVNVRFKPFKSLLLLLEELARKMKVEIPQELRVRLAPVVETREEVKVTNEKHNYVKELDSDLGKWIFQRAQAGSEWEVEFKRLFEMSEKHQHFNNLKKKDFAEAMFQSLANTPKQPSGFRTALIRHSVYTNLDAKDQVERISKLLKEYSMPEDPSNLLIIIKAQIASKLQGNGSAKTFIVPSVPIAPDKNSGAFETAHPEQEEVVVEAESTELSDSKTGDNVTIIPGKAGLTALVREYFLGKVIPKPFKGAEMDKFIQFLKDEKRVSYSRENISYIISMERMKQSDIQSSSSKSEKVGNTDGATRDSKISLAQIIRSLLNPDGTYTNEYPNRTPLFKFINEEYTDRNFSVGNLDSVLSRTRKAMQAEYKEQAESTTSEELVVQNEMVTEHSVSDSLVINEKNIVEERSADTTFELTKTAEVEDNALRSDKSTSAQINQSSLDIVEVKLVNEQELSHLPAEDSAFLEFKEQFRQLGELVDIVRANPEFLKFLFKAKGSLKYFKNLDV